MADAARAVIRHHLARLCHELELVERSTAAPEDQTREPVHQVRVISRRLTAALLVFGEFFSGKRGRKLKKRLRRLRRLAAPVRALDVLILEVEHLLDSGAAEDRERLEPLQRWLGEKRVRRGRELARSLAGKRDKFVRAARDRDFRAGDAATLASAMPPALDGPLKRVLNATASVDFTELHRLRIAGKRLRYTLEIFASCQEPGQVSPARSCVETMQQRLGDINDCHEFAAWMRRLASKQASSQRAAARWLADYFENRRLELSRQFQEEWTTSLRPTLERWRPSLAGARLSAEGKRKEAVDS